jgi:small-conductance mechanosensitive channel
MIIRGPIRIVLLLAALLACAAGPRARAQVAPADAQRTLDVLQDPAKRDQLIATLRTIAQAQPQPSAPVAPGSLGAEILTGASGFLHRVSTGTAAAFGAARQLPLARAWLADPSTRAALLEIIWRLALVVAVGLVVEWAIRRAVRLPIRALIHRAPNGKVPVPDDDPQARAERGEIEPPRRQRTAALALSRRLPLVLGRLVLELLPILGFLLAGHLVAGALGGRDQAQVILLAVIDAYALCAALLCIARMMFAPDVPQLRLLAISDNVAAYAMRWSRRLIVVGVVGYALAEVGLLLGLSQAAHDGLLKVVALLDHVFLGIIVLQQRRRVRRLLRAPQGASGLWAGMRNWLARVWHWLALALLIALWLAWAAEIPNGYATMLHFFFAFIAVAVAARLLLILALGGLDRAMMQRPDARSRYPGLDARLAAYHPVLTSLVRVVVFLIAAAALLQLWGLGTIDWLLGSAAGRRVMSSLVDLLLTVLLALAIWEAVNAGFERHLARLTSDAQAARSARLRTLLPLLRTTLLITILIVAGMMMLSEIGVDIGPLLAGAGIVGVAIGFGSQTLVRDVITGVFLLLENAMQVGDTVTVSGLSGTVENLSVRTIRLRAGDGSVHIIPFSSVTSVTNVNRGLGNAAVNVCVAAGEDTDRVSDVLKEIVAGMRQDADCASQMLSDLQLWGVDKLDGASVTIAGQVVCTDSGRWSVQRELNRRIKRRFAELGIQLYNPMERVVAVRQMKDEAQDEPAIRRAGN